MNAPGPLSVPGPTLPLTERKARYGVTFLESVCSQFGVAIQEPKSGADVRAIDCEVSFLETPVHVQVKCSSRPLPKKSSWVTMGVHEDWRRKWSKIRNPVYLLWVIVPDDPDAWIAERGKETLHRTWAIWTRIDTANVGASIRIPIGQRFSVDTVSQWYADLRSAYGAQPIAGGA